MSATMGMNQSIKAISVETVKCMLSSPKRETVEYQNTVVIEMEKSWIDFGRNNGGCMRSGQVDKIRSRT